MREPSTNFPYSEIDTEVDLLCEQMQALGVNQRQAIAFLSWHKGKMAETEITQRALILGNVIGEMLDSQNFPIDVHSLAFAAGLDQAYALGSQAEVGRRLKVTRASISKCTAKWKDILGYTVFKFTRSERNRENCSAAQKTNHWRKRKFQISHA